MQEKKYPPTICVDFDGVLADYSGWKGVDHLGKPRKGARAFLNKIRKRGLEFTVLTTRQPEKVRAWFKKNRLPAPVEVTNLKIPATVYIDDRGLKFEGDFVRLWSELKEFRVHWKEGLPFRGWLD